MNFKVGDKVRVMKDEGKHNIPLSSVVTLKAWDPSNLDWTVEEHPGKLLWEKEIGIACERCQPGGDLGKPCTCGRAIEADIKRMGLQLESITIQVAEIKKFFDKGDFLRTATRADELSGAAMRLFNMAYARAFPKG